MRRILVIVVVLCCAPGAALAHGPATAIGRAVEALRQVDVSYDPASSVSEVDAGNLGLLAGDGVYAALLPAAAVT